MSLQERTWRSASIVAVIVMVALVAFDWIVPEPDVKANERERRSEALELKDENSRMLTAISQSRGAVQASLWQADPDVIGAETMALVDRVAGSNQVKVQAFRPQRTQVVDEIERHPYSAVLRGSFPKVVQTVKKLQAPGTKLAVTSVQISAADGETDTVTATIGLAAFSEPQ